MHLREFLTDTHAYMPPASALAGLDDEAANRRLPGAPHSVAEIVAHLNFWQSWFLSRCRGNAEPMAAAAAVGWPAVESWDVVRGQFLEGLTEAALLSEAADHPWYRPSIFRRWRTTPRIRRWLISLYTMRITWGR